MSLPSPQSAVILFLGLLISATVRADLVELIAKSKPSVVIVGSFSPTDSPRFGLRGTGFVVGDGTSVVTNAHVLPDATPSAGAVRQLVVQVPKPPGGLEMRAATVVGMDRSHDLALLKIDGPALPALSTARSGYVPEGSPVAFIGFPIGGVLGYSPVTHRGIVSSVTAIAPPMPTAQQLNEVAIKRLRDGSFDIYQLDATAYPGNSGGPLLHLSQPTGITYAIPVKFVNDLLERR
jgi:serine protease Do